MRTQRRWIAEADQAMWSAAMYYAACCCNYRKYAENYTASDSMEQNVHVEWDIYITREHLILTEMNIILMPR